MTIRFTCAECSSVLKIKDELAGTTGRCPKCKTKFVVPDPPMEDLAADHEPAERPLVRSESRDSESNDKIREPTRSVERPVEPAAQSNSDDFEEDSPNSAVPVNVPAPAHATNHLSIEDPMVPEVAKASEPQNDPFHLQLEDSSVVASGARVASSPPPIESRKEQLSDRNQSVPVTSESAPVTSVSVPVTNVSAPVTDEVDLDSPPKFVSSLGMPMKSSLGPSEMKKTELPRIVIENKGDAPKLPLPKKREESFDPMKFLMDDAAAQKPISIPMSADDDSDLSLSDDSSDEIVNRPTPHPLTRPTPVATASRATPEKVDLATAAKMMKKAIKESQADAAKQREIDASSGFDYTQFFREFGVRGLAILAATIVLPLVLYYGVDYALSSRFKVPKLGYVTGTVKMDGRPLADAIVYFAPMEAVIPDARKEVPRTSIGVTDANGFYRMMYSKSHNIAGVGAGRCRVWVSHIGATGEDVPPEWMELATRTTEVTVGSQKAPYDINLESRKPDPKKK